MELDTEVGVSWIDWEIWSNYMNDSAAQAKGNSGDEEIVLDSEVLRNIWKPDIYIGPSPWKLFNPNLRIGLEIFICTKIPFNR